MTDIDLGAAYLAHAPALVGWFARRVGSREIAEDLVIDVFIKAYRFRASYVDQGAPVIAWLYVVAHTVLVSYYRSVGRRDDATTVALLPADSLRAALASDVVDWEIVAAIEALPPRQGRAVGLRYLEDCELADVADRLPSSIKGAQYLIARGLATLQVSLADWRPRPNDALGDAAPGEGMDQLIERALASGRIRPPG
jgi:RNA polymerase sigma-70 factor, ECF subfamily